MGILSNQSLQNRRAEENNEHSLRANHWTNIAALKWISYCVHTLILKTLLVITNIDIPIHTVEKWKQLTQASEDLWRDKSETKHPAGYKKIQQRKKKLWAAHSLSNLNVYIIWPGKRELCYSSYTSTHNRKVLFLSWSISRQHEEKCLIM